MEFIDSSNERKRSWLVSLAMRNDGEDIELNSWMILELVTELMPLRDGEILLMTARRAG